MCTSSRILHQHLYYGLSRAEDYSIFARRCEFMLAQKWTECWPTASDVGTAQTPGQWDVW